MIKKLCLEEETEELGAKDENEDERDRNTGGKQMKKRTSHLLEVVV